MPQLNISKYKTIVFDCDGVLLDSNQLKIQAYLDTAIKFGATEQQAKALVDYHVLLGGISRYTKFEYFLREIVKQPVTDKAMQELFEDFGGEVRRLLSNCEIAPGLAELRSAIPDCRWLVVSGGDQAEIGQIFTERGIADMFDAGIFGSPDNKDQILARELESGNIVMPALFVGDSKYDHIASTGAGLDFVFLSGWTDFDGWQQYCQSNNIKVLPALNHLVV
ncbi:MAG TPA: HAD family hydrolase [Methylophilaceae bacterium]|nr:HAD family hydrolase [Methylophilaceae bacterium]